MTRADRRRRKNAETHRTRANRFGHLASWWRGRSAQRPEPLPASKRVDLLGIAVFPDGRVVPCDSRTDVLRTTCGDLLGHYFGVIISDNMGHEVCIHQLVYAKTSDIAAPIAKRTLALGVRMEEAVFHRERCRLEFERQFKVKRDRLRVAFDVAIAAIRR